MAVGRSGTPSACPDSDSSSLGVWGCQSVPHLTAVVEVKSSDWDRMADRAVRRNVRRQVKQIWDYVESELASDREPCPGVIFSKKLADSEQAAYVETEFNDYGIQVVWDGEEQASGDGRDDRCTTPQLRR